VRIFRVKQREGYRPEARSWYDWCMVIGVGDIADAVKGLADVAQKVAANLRERRVQKAIAERYDEMFRNPKHPYRSTKVLGRVIGDRTPDLEVTRAILTGLIVKGVRGNLGEKDTWVLPDNWVLDDSGKIVRDQRDHGVLKPGIEPGNL
jgi:hypothetical protein